MRFFRLIFAQFRKLILIVLKPVMLRVLWSWLAGLLFALPSLPGMGATNSAWFFRSWQTEDGLPEHTIVDLAQTSDGYLWAATHEGLFRFDGVRFQEFTPAMRTGLSSAQIRVMLLDRSGRLWLGKDGGVVLSIQNGAVAQSLELGGASSKSQPRSIAEDSQGSIWVSDRAEAIFRIQRRKIQPFGAAEGLAAQGICRLVTDTQENLWFTQGGAVGVFRNERFVTLISLDQPSIRIAKAREGGIWISSGMNLYRYHEGSTLQLVAKWKADAGRTEVEVTVLYEDNSHNLWIGTASDGLLQYDSKLIQRVDANLPAITAITQDSEGDLWVGTRGGGLNRIRPRAAEVLGLASGLPFVAVQSACEDNGRTVWVAGQNGALARRSNDHWELVSEVDGWSGGWVTCLASDAGGGVFLGTRDQGVFHYIKGGFVALDLNKEMKDAFVRSLYSSPHGDLWIGCNSGGKLYRFRDGHLKIFPLPSGVSNVRTMVEDADSSLWAATSDGLLLHIVGDLLSDESASILNRSHRGIRCLHVTDDGSLWIGYAGQGIGRIKNGHYSVFQSQQGLWDDYISQIVSDNNDRLWIAGNRGIFQVSRSELEAVAQGRRSRLRSVVLGRGEGLPNLQASFGVWPVSARCADGRFLLPMLTGLAVIQPNLFHRSALPPPVAIELVRINGRTAAAAMEEANGTVDPPPVNLQDLPAVLHLGPGVNQMEIEFTSSSLASPENVIFHYQLEGVDQDWVDSGTVRVARYPRIPPGKYRFRVAACDHNGVWNEAGATLEMIIKPHIWEAAWFRVAGAVGAAAAIAAGVLLILRRRYQRKLERLTQQQALERERTRIAQDLHDDLGAGLVEINLGSELAQDFVLSPDEVREHAREIGTRAREMVIALDEIVWAVNPKHDNVSSLATYFCQFAQHFLKTTPIRCHLEVSRDIPNILLNAEQRHSLFLAFKEALSNVVQHSGATDLRLAISAHDGTLAISIRDNGCGLVPDVLRGRTGADGLLNMQRRLVELGGRCEVESHPGSGTTLTFQVPLFGTAGNLADNSIEVL